MYQHLPGHAKALAEAIQTLTLDPKKQEVTFTNGSGLKLTRDDAYGKAKQQKGGKVIGKQVHKDQTFLIFAP